MSISNAFKRVFPGTKIKFCLWHFGRALEVNKKKYIKLEDEENDEVNILYRCIRNLPFIDPDYVIKIFKYIKEKNVNSNFDKFLKYFEDYYIRRINLREWNYFDVIEHTTNNCCESYNNKINNYFNKKPTFFKLLYILRNEEDEIIKEYERVSSGIWNSKRKIVYGRTDEKDILVRFYEDKINEMKEYHMNEDEIIGEWFKCLKRLGGK